VTVAYGAAVDVVVAIQVELVPVVDVLAEMVV